ncbi:permease prefix domain 1-containing protein [Paenibacillus tarimensis]
MAKVAEFEEYLLTILEGLDLEPGERDDLFEEWHQHLTDLMNKFMNRGFSKQEAHTLALQQFGDAADLHAEMKRGFPASRNMVWLKELLIWSLCLIASSIGPWLLINARYSLSFILFPLLVLLACAIFYHVLLSRIPRRPIWMIPGTLLVYAAFLFISVRLTSAEFVWSLFTSSAWGGTGLFTISTIHLFWIAVVACRLISRPDASPMTSAVRSSFEFWAMNLIAVLLVMTEFLLDSSEGKTFILNIFLLYGTLHQVVQPRFMIITKNKLQYWIQRVL